MCGLTSPGLRPARYLPERIVPTLESAACGLAEQYWHAREAYQFGVPVGTVEEMVEQAQACATQPVILADSGDNPTGGGVGDRAEVLEALLQRTFANALVAGIVDLPATELCYRHKAGDSVTLRIGATLDPEGQPICRRQSRDFVSAACR